MRAATFGMTFAVLACATAASADVAKLSVARAQASAQAGNVLCIIDAENGAKENILVTDTAERRKLCDSPRAARPPVKKGLGFFGWSAIGLIASGGAAAVAQNSNGRPASP